MVKKRYISIAIVVFFIQCSENEKKAVGETLDKIIYLNNLSHNYDFNYSQNTPNDQIITFFNRTKHITSAGDIFYFNITKPVHIKDLKISNLRKNETKDKQLFKLFINNKAHGKFEINEKIVVNKKVNSLRILFLKPVYQYLAEGWKERTVIKILKTNKEGIFYFSPKIALTIIDSTNVNFVSQTLRKPIKKKVLALNRKIINRYNAGNENIKVNGLYYLKNDSQIVQYNLQLRSSGSVDFYQLVSDKFRKKIIQEFFLSGNWNCIKLEHNKVLIRLTVTLTGYFSEKKIPIIQNESISINCEIKDKILKSDKLFEKVYFDFPDDAFVNIKSLIPELKVEMPYAGKHNFTGEQLYQCNKCFLRYEVTKALLKVQTKLSKKQMSLKIYDCYRPFSVQAVMFKKFPIPGYVADSIGGSTHNRGSAVDLTILDKNGIALQMGTEYDELSKKSNHNYIFFPDTVLNNRIFLKELMISSGFTPIRSEWWHYNYIYARKFPKVNDSFICD